LQEEEEEEEEEGRTGVRPIMGFQDEKEDSRLQGCVLR
jgi:hypothetical protein